MPFAQIVGQYRGTQRDVPTVLADEGRHVADGRNQRDRVERADALDDRQPARVLIRARLLGELSIRRGDAVVEELPALAHFRHEPAHARCERPVRLRVE